MSIANGVRLGLDLSRGARRETRADEVHQQQLKQAQEDAAYQARMRPLAEQQAKLGLRDLEGQVTHGEATRPLELQQAKLGLSALESEQQFQEQYRPVQLEAAKTGLAGARQQQAQQQTAFDQSQEDRDMALRRDWVNQQTAVEFARVQRGGNFSERFLRDSYLVGSPVAPLRLADGEHIDALDTMRDLLDPRRPSNPYDDSRLMQAANVLLAQDLKTGGTNPTTGEPIVNKRIVNAYQAKDRQGKPIPGELYVELEVTDKAGNKYLAPATVGQSTADDAELKTVSLPKLIQRINAQSVYAEAVNKNPRTREQILAYGQKMNQGKSDIKSDEVTWQGRPRKFNDVYKLYNEDASLKTPEGVPLVDFESFEWTQGDAEKLKFLRAAAKENSNIYAEMARVGRKDPQKAAELAQQIVDPIELYEMAQAAQGSEQQKRAQELLDRMGQGGGDGPNEDAERIARTEFFAQPNWHLTPDLPSWAQNRMTREMMMQRRDGQLQQYRQRLAANQSQTTEKQAANEAMTYLNTHYSELSPQQKRKWVLDNSQHLDAKLRKELLSEIAPFTLRRG